MWSSVETGEIRENTMSKIQKRDYYFGAALSIFLSKNIDACPSLVECSDTSCQYRMTSGSSEDFHLYMKYASHCTINADERVWQFSLTDTDKARINECIRSGLKTYIALICGDSTLSDGEIAILTQTKYKEISHKTGIRLKLQGKSPKKYIIADRKSSNIIKIDRNLFDSKITDIKD